MRIRYGWELALAALLVIEIVAFGAINPRMLDLNMLLFSTSDFICIGIVALPGDTPDLTARRIVRADQRRINYLYQS